MFPLLPERWLDQPLETIASLAPIQPLDWPLMAERGLTVACKREDLLHPRLGGNKLYKLHAHLLQARAAGHNHVLSFGGPWSNHIYALAAAGEALGLRTTGVIRGERPSILSATLVDAQAMGMTLQFVSRQDYDRKSSLDLLHQLRQRLGDFHCVPEGGGDLLGAAGCREFARALPTLGKFDVVCCAVGTGATLAGLAAGVPKNVSVCGFSVLKGEGDLREQVQARLRELGSSAANWRLETAYHCGGYARLPDALARFMQEFESQTGIELDPVYTAKMMWGMAQKARSGDWPPGTRLLALHSGGIQGRRGFPRQLGLAPHDRSTPANHNNNAA